MTTLLVEPSTEPRQAWRYVLWSRFPDWVSHVTLRNEKDELVLDRPTGRQVINPGEWLVRSLDGEILWFETEAEFRKAFREAR